MKRRGDEEMIVVEHPLARHKLTILRDERTDPSTFRRTLKELSTLLAVEATRNLPVNEVKVRTPLSEAKGYTITSDVLIVPIFRAGLGMLDGFLELLPEAKVGFIGIYRDEINLQPKRYYYNIPAVSPETHTFILDPMIATGGSIRAALELLISHQLRKITVVSVIAYSETVKRLSEEYSSKLNLRFITVALDEELNERGFIVPGLGDAGDRTFGTISQSKGGER